MTDDARMVDTQKLFKKLCQSLFRPKLPAPFRAVAVLRVLVEDVHNAAAVVRPTTASRRLGLRRQCNLAERLTKLKRRTSSVAHIDQHVENPQELLSESQRHRRVAMCEVLHQRRNVRWNECSMPTLQVVGSVADNREHLVREGFGRVRRR